MAISLSNESKTKMADRIFFENLQSSIQELKFKVAFADQVFTLVYQVNVVLTRLRFVFQFIASTTPLFLVASIATDT